jgi:hypothetical protein
MGKTCRVNFYKDEYDVYIGRPGKGLSGDFGNPFKDGTREENISRFRSYFYDLIARSLEFRMQIEFLRNKRLACFCPLNKTCHGDVYVEYFEKTPPPTVDDVLDGIGCL